MRTLYEWARQIIIRIAGEDIALTAVHIKHALPAPRILLLHGNPGSLDDFAELVPALEFAELLLFDLPGFGRSLPPGASVDASSLGGLAAIGRALTAHFAWRDPFHVLGHSHGAGIAQAMAWNDGEGIESLVLVSSLGTRAHAAYRQLSVPGAAAALAVAAGCVVLPGSRSWLKGVQKGILKKAFHPAALPEGRLDRDIDAIVGAPHVLPRMAELAKGKPCDALARNAASIAAPTVFLHGDADRLVPAACPRALHELRVAAGRRSDFELVEGAGHMLPITHPGLIGECVKRATERGDHGNAAPHGRPDPAPRSSCGPGDVLSPRSFPRTRGLAQDWDGAS